MTTTRRTRRAPMTADQRAAYAEARRTEIRELNERLTAFLESDEVAPEQIAEWEARFDGQYSPHNAHLIGMQRPDATVVRGYVTWRAEYGRQVRKGEVGIRIKAPAGWVDENGNTVKADDAADGDKVRQRFKLISVFDISQTDPIEVPAAAAA